MSVLSSVLVAVVIAVIVRRFSRPAPMPRRIARGAYWSALWGLLIGAPSALFVAPLAALVAVVLAVGRGSRPVRGGQVLLPPELRLRVVLAGVSAALCAVFLLLLGPLRSWTARLVSPDRFAWRDLPAGDEVWQVWAMGLVLASVAYLCLRQLRGISDSDVAVEAANIVVRCLLVCFAAAAGGLSGAVLLRIDGLTISSLMVPSLVLTVWALTTRPQGLRAADARRRLEQQRQQEQLPVA